MLYSLRCDIRQLTAWFLGLQSLAPLNCTYMSAGAMFWARANMKIDREAYFQGESPMQVWADSLLTARSLANQDRARAATVEVKGEST